MRIKSLLIIFILSGLNFSCNHRKSQVVVEQKSTIADSQIESKEQKSLNSENVRSKEYYLNLLKEALIKKAENNSEIDSIFSNEDGNLQFNNEGSFLSIYDFNAARVFEGDIDNDNKNDVIVSIENDGGGAGGNVSITENYMINNDLVSFIDGIQNPPKNKFGYRYSIANIENGFILVDIIFYEGDDLSCCPSGNEETIKCKIEGNELIVVN